MKSKIHPPRSSTTSSVSVPVAIAPAKVASRVFSTTGQLHMNQFAQRGAVMGLIGNGRHQRLCQSSSRSNLREDPLSIPIAFWKTLHMGLLAFARGPGNEFLPEPFFERGHLLLELCDELIVIHALTL